MTRYGDGGDDEPFDNAAAMWWSNVERALRGKRGQQAILDLYHALHALPTRELVSGHLANGGKVCAVGALALYRRTQAGEAPELVLAELEGVAPPYCTCGHLKSRHTARGCLDCAAQNMLVAWYRGRRYDEEGPTAGAGWRHLPKQPLHAYVYADGHTEGDSYSTAQVGVAVGTTYMLAWYLGYKNDEAFRFLTPAARWEAMVAWCVANLQPVPA